jgi:hypothetical protein
MPKVFPLDVPFTLNSLIIARIAHTATLLPQRFGLPYRQHSVYE